MTLIIETGTGKADSQSYVSKAEINSYFDSEVNSVDLSKLMPRARLYIDTLTFVGSETIMIGA